MIATTIMGALAVLFAYLAKYKNAQFSLKISFSLIFIFLALRYNFGNDYEGYLRGFIEVNHVAQIDYFNNSFHFEPGWLFLCRLFKPIGFFGMTAVLALFNCAVYYRFIKKFVPIKYYWLAVFLYIFSPEFMLIHASAMRQSLAISIFIFSLDYLYRKDAIRYFLCIGIAWFFHSSALILFPIYFLSYSNWKMNKKTTVILVTIFISLFMVLNSIGSFLNKFIATYFNQYEIYQDKGVIGTGLGVIYLSILFILVLHFENSQNKETSLIFRIAIISFLFIPLSLPIQLIGRVAMYFTPATIITYPIIQMSLKKSNYKTIFIVSLISMTIFNYIQFFLSEINRNYYGTYHTIFTSFHQF